MSWRFLTSGVAGDCSCFRILRASSTMNGQLDAIKRNTRREFAVQVTYFFWHLSRWLRHLWSWQYTNRALCPAWPAARDHPLGLVVAPVAFLDLVSSTWSLGLENFKWNHARSRFEDSTTPNNMTCMSAHRSILILFWLLQLRMSCLAKLTRNSTFRNVTPLGLISSFKTSSSYLKVFIAK